MVKLQFTNAVVYDDGYGLTVNGKQLSDIISTALGVSVAGVYGYNSGLPPFSSNSCNVTVIIEPHPTSEYIETDETIWNSVEELEEDMHEQFNQKTATAKG